MGAVKQASLVVVAVVVACVAAQEGAYMGDMDEDLDAEAVLKCDACKAVSKKFEDTFEEFKQEFKEGEKPTDEEIISVAESVCDDAWEGYSTTKVEGEDRLAGPGLGREVAKDAADEAGIWSRRLQDMCDEFLAEVNDEKIIYHTWASGNSLENFICRGEGTFAACSADDWGPWPGDDYEDYEDNAEFDDIHDEF